MRAGLGALLFGGVGGVRRVKWGTGGGCGTRWADMGRIKKTPSGVDGSTERVVCEPPNVAAHSLILLQNPDIFKVEEPSIEVLAREAAVVHFIL